MTTDNYILFFLYIFIFFRILQIIDKLIKNNSEQKKKDFKIVGLKNVQEEIQYMNIINNKEAKYLNLNTKIPEAKDNY